MSDATREPKRVNVNFSGEAFEALTRLSKAKGKSMSDILRDAIALEEWVNKTQDEGDRILVERDGNLREVVFRG